MKRTVALILTISLFWQQGNFPISTYPLPQNHFAFESEALAPPVSSEITTNHPQGHIALVHKLPQVDKPNRRTFAATFSAGLAALLEACTKRPEPPPVRKAEERPASAPIQKEPEPQTPVVVRIKASIFETIVDEIRNAPLTPDGKRHEIGGQIYSEDRSSPNPVYDQKKTNVSLQEHEANKTSLKKAIERNSTGVKRQESLYGDYQKLFDKYDKLIKVNQALVEEFNKLVNEHKKLIATYNDFVTKHNAAQTSQDQLPIKMAMNQQKIRIDASSKTIDIKKKSLDENASAISTLKPQVKAASARYDDAVKSVKEDITHSKSIKTQLDRKVAIRNSTSDQIQTQSTKALELRTMIYHSHDVMTSWPTVTVWLRWAFNAGKYAVGALNLKNPDGAGHNSKEDLSDIRDYFLPSPPDIKTLGKRNDPQASALLVVHFHGLIIPMAYRIVALDKPMTYGGMSYPHTWEYASVVIDGAFSNAALNDQVIPINLANEINDSQGPQRTIHAVFQTFLKRQSPREGLALKTFVAFISWYFQPRQFVRSMAEVLDQRFDEVAREKNVMKLLGLDGDSIKIASEEVLKSLNGSILFNTPAPSPTLKASNQTSIAGLPGFEQVAQTAYIILDGMMHEFSVSLLTVGTGTTLQTFDFNRTPRSLWLHYKLKNPALLRAA